MRDTLNSAVNPAVNMGVTVGPSGNICRSAVKPDPGALWSRERVRGALAGPHGFEEAQRAWRHDEIDQRDAQIELWCRCEN